MTIEEAKAVIYGNVVYACEKAGFAPQTTRLVQDACDTIIAIVDACETIIALVDRKTEPKRSKWIYHMDGEGNVETVSCGVCGGWVDITIPEQTAKFVYCPYCGAEMMADHKTEPTHEIRTETHECVKDTHDKTDNSSEKPNNSTISKMEQVEEPTGYNLSPVDKGINVPSKDESYIERKE